MKKALVLEGPGFADQGSIVSNLKNMDYEIITRSVGFGSGDLLIPEFLEADFILLRAPWTASPEEKMMVRILGDRLAKSFKNVIAKGGFRKEQHVVGVGRGALILLFSEFFSFFDREKIDWRETFLHEGPWLTTTVLPSSNRLLSLVSGRAVPDIAKEKKDKFVEWLKVDREVVGWRMGSLSLSLVDILAYADRTQLSDFGYQDLLRFPTQVSVLESLATGDTSLANIDFGLLAK